MLLRLQRLNYFHDLHCDQKTQWTALSSQSYALWCSEGSLDHSVGVEWRTCHPAYSSREEGVFQSLSTIRVTFQAEDKLW